MVDQMVGPRSLGADQGYCRNRHRSGHHLAAGPVFVHAPVRAPARHGAHAYSAVGSGPRQGTAARRGVVARRDALRVSAPQWLSWAILALIAVSAAAAVAVVLGQVIT